MLALSLALVLVATTPAERAQTLSDRSRSAFEAGDLEAAERYLREAYTLDPSPDLLFNLARVFEVSGQSQQALDAYREYLRLRPNADDRGLVERRIGSLETKTRIGEPAAPRRTVTTPVPKPPGPSPVPWVVGGLGVGALITGSVFGILASTRESQAEEEPTHLRATELLSEGRTFGTIRTVALIAGTVTVAAAIPLLFALSDRSNSEIAWWRSVFSGGLAGAQID